ncbi:MAG: hypothetical protein OEV44_03880 [Spirochaetota bacterium]|nr:hypothetical protein [Spirochaetota bacterium]
MRLKAFIIITVFFIASLGFTSVKNPYFRFNNKSKIDYFPKGAINWTEGYFIAKANSKTDLIEKNAKKLNSILQSPAGKLEIEEELIQEAKKNLLNIILKTKVDSYNYVKDYFVKDDRFKDFFIEEMGKNIIVLPPVYLGSGKIEAVVKYHIYGKGSLTDLMYKLDDNFIKIPTVEDIENTKEPSSYSAIIIDLRKKFKFHKVFTEKLLNIPPKVRNYFEQLESGKKFSTLSNKISYNDEKKLIIFKGVMSIKEQDELLVLSNDLLYQEVINELYRRSLQTIKDVKFSPSLFPAIYNSKDQLICSKDMVEKSDRSTIQYVRYVRDSLIFYNIEIVGNNPLYIFADKIRGENNSDIIISPEDSMKILSDFKTSKNMVKSKVFLLID